MQSAETKKFPASDSRGFTLVELLVVVGIISVLVAILLPALNKARWAAQRTVCMSNQRQTYQALCMYAIDFKEYPCTMSRGYVEANVATLSNGEVAGFGFISPFGSSADGRLNGPFALLIERHYADPRILQCTGGVGIPLAVPRRGYTPNYVPLYYPLLTDKRWDPGLWFDYNGPIVRGGTARDFGQNNLAHWLGGACSDGLGNNNTWGLSWKEGKHDNKTNSYRPGIHPVGEVALLDCISVIAGSGVYGNFVAEYEPHDEMPISSASAFNQGGGADSMPIRRNVLFGDGHGIYIKRSNRNFSNNDSY